jgi:hypothetical protein
MKVIIYAGGEYTTGDEIAESLLAYSKALADEDTAETVEIPILNEDGSVGAATFLVGPSSQIVAKDAIGDFEELLDPDAVAALNRRTGSLHLVASAETTQNPADWVLDDEY